jgi:thiamine biosynthesis lipoprotein ApbE
MAADGLATAAFVLGPSRGLRLLERAGVGGVLIAPSGAVRMTRDLASDARSTWQSRPCSTASSVC